MSEYNVLGPVGVNQNIDENSATQDEDLGKCVVAKDMDTTDYGWGEFIYLKGVASTVVGSVVTFNHGDYQTALGVADAVGLIGVAMAATVANEYGWYQIKGRAVCKVAASFAADNVAYLTAVAGTIDDAVVVGDEIYASISQSAIDTPSTGLAEVSIQYPFTTNASN